MKETNPDINVSINKNIDEFIKFIFNKYFYRQIDREILESDINLIKMIKLKWEVEDILENIIKKHYDKINKKGLIWTKIKLDNFAKIMEITDLNLSYNQNIIYEGIKNMVQMRTLELLRNYIITNEGIKNQEIRMYCYIKQ